MTLGEMQSMLLFRFNDPNGALYTPTQLILLLNQAYRYVWNKLIEHKVYLDKKITTISFVSGIQETILPVDVDKIITVLDENEVTIPLYDEEFSKRSDVVSCYRKRAIAANVIGIPDEQATQTREDLLGWYRIPNISFNLKIVYNRQYIKIVDTTPTTRENNQIPSNFHEVIVDYATILGWSSRGIREEVINTINFWQASFQTGLDTLINNFSHDAETQQQVPSVPGRCAGCGSLGQDRG